ncbi:HYR domain-containing protein, partial [Mangrovimonas sp. AS39]
DQTTFDCSNIGDNTVTLTVTDNNSNVSTCTATVTVQDNIAPTAVCQDITVQLDNTGNASIVAQDIDNGSNDACGIASLAIDQTTFDCSNIGDNTVTLTVTDNNSNVSTCTATVTVQDNIAPTISCPTPDAYYNTDPGECSATLSFNASASDNCNGSLAISYNIAGTPISFPYDFPSGTTIVTALANDGNGQISSCDFNVVVEDHEAPEIPTLDPIIEYCSTTVTPPTTSDNCDSIVTGTSNESLYFDTAGNFTIYWTFTDSSNNSIIGIQQEVTILDDEAPVPDLATLPDLNLDGCQISDISELTIPTATDGCDADGEVILGTLPSDFVFPFSFSGTEIIDWEFIDSNGNVTIQTQNITLTPPNIDGGTLQGTFEGTQFSSQIDISSCQEEINIDLDLTGEIGNIIQWEQFAVNEGVWNIISNTSDSYSVTFAVGELESTYYRVLIQIGNCNVYSSLFYVRSLPPGSAPTIENLDVDSNYCLGEEVNLLATSNYLATEEAFPDYPPGDFNQGQLNTQDPNGWLVDGETGGFTAGGSATKPRNWSAKTCNNQENGDIVYCGNDGKYTIAYGDFSSPQYNGAIPTTLETPIMDLSNVASASLDFDQAYYFSDQDYAVIEISIDGGVNYSTLVLMHAVGSGDSDWYTAGTAESVAGSTPTEYNFETDNTSIPLDAYIGESNVRIRWSFTGTTTQSAWAMDNIYVYQEVYVDTELEWTDGIGDPSEDPIVTGETQVPISFVPEVPGSHNYGATALINGCRSYDEDGTDLIGIKVFHSYAGEDVIFTPDECGQNTVQLNAYDNRLTATQNAAKGAYTLPDNCVNCDDEGAIEVTDIAGEWAVTGSSSCGGNFSISDINDPDAQFTGDAGIYNLTWTVNGCTDNMNIEIINCDLVDFDGTDDYVDFGQNNYDLSNNDFSIEVWVKPETIGGGVQAILSKRDASFSGNAHGYDLRINNSGHVVFRWNKTGIINSSPYTIDTARWYHVAVTRSGNEYRLYIDGILIKTGSGGQPSSNNYKTLLGAMDHASSSVPTNHFNGWIDELRIWNKALSVEHIRQMMNQEIEALGADVGGVVLGSKINGPDANQDGIDDNPLLWSNLEGYYRMDIACGSLSPNYSVGTNGRLKNITSSQQETAPLPYTTIQAGDWGNDNTPTSPWTNYSVWNYPNSLGINGSKIDWNIVETSHDVYSHNDNITLLGLLNNSGSEITISNPNTAQDENNNGNALWVTHYLKLNGQIDLVGQSQLVQKRYNTSQLNDSELESTSSGFIERDQQGTANLYNYNYWSSPVSGIGSSVAINANYTVGGVLMDGTTSSNPIAINWIGGYDANPGSPISLPNHWLWTYNALANTYLQWNQVGSTGNIPTGNGYTMKGSGSGSGTDTQNYVFKGKPHNGLIQNTNTAISNGNEILIGNPYPSAMDANEFIRDNIPNALATAEGSTANPGSTNAIDGALYFWIHYLSNSTHILAAYEGGYAVYTLTGAEIPSTPPPTEDGYEISGEGSSGLMPGRYIPVGQGFFVGALEPGTGGQIKFENDQRIFRRENSTNSIFLKSSNTENASLTNDEEEEDLIKRIRITTVTPNNLHRHLMVGFVENGTATDSFDYGYDAKNMDDYPTDVSWNVENTNFIIQGVGEFDSTKQYPLNVKLAQAGDLAINLRMLENFDEEIDVFIYDSLTGEYSQFNEVPFSINLEAGEYNSRFYLTFESDESTLSIIEDLTNEISVNYLNNSGEIFINTYNKVKVNRVQLIDMAGKVLQTWNSSQVTELANSKIKLPVRHISSGNYIIKLDTGLGTSINKKVIIE